MYRAIRFILNSNNIDFLMNKEIRTSGILKIRVPLLAVVTVSLPFFAFLTCIYLSVVNNFSLATATHCGIMISHLF
ncbi:hypothetical protein Avbf_04779 [Armadillidium vulgare]|nr:hypothetical protein Avbf_04779 [Armadillidium vulgare]